MRRTLFRAASLLSTILFGIAVALWVRGYFASDSLYVKYHAHPYIHRMQTRHGPVNSYYIAETTVTNGRGCIQVKTESDWLSEKPIPQIDFARGQSGASDLRLLRPRFSRLGIEHAVDYSLKSESFRVPTWMMVAVFSVLPLWREGHRYGKRRRSRRNRCIQCGYSLTGNTSGICPECGNPKED